MYCPECKQEFEGKFCPECGAKLIEKPAANKGFSINLGDANAISGGINLSDSHDVHNTDNSVHNITNNSSVVNNITNIAAAKSNAEILQESKLSFLEMVNEALAAGHLSQEILAALDAQRLRLGLSEADANDIIASARKNANTSRQKALTPIQLVTVRQIKRLLADNDTEQLKRQLPRLEAIAYNSGVEDAQFSYFLGLAGVDPQKLISENENGLSDDYWKLYWSYIAYLKVNDFRKAEDMLFALQSYTEYPEENISLLSIVGTQREFGNENAMELLEMLQGNYSPQLEVFGKSLFAMLTEEVPEGDAECDFYIQNILKFTDAKAQEAEANALHSVTLKSTGSNSFKVVMVLKSKLNISLAEAKALLECTPINILNNVTNDVARDIYDNLCAAGAEAEIN